ncbi:hypothetical protein BC940DRAFT_364129 [Gongronella butleri]|nr:hypothetical protein BC940DRAFT_364129 [Gongronella butleri]
MLGKIATRLLLFPFFSMSQPPSTMQDPYETTKRLRMTLACERCRTKKVKCDFAHPRCGRCETLNAPCSYTGSSTQIDIFKLQQLSDSIDALREKVNVTDQRVCALQSSLQPVLEQFGASTTPHVQHHAADRLMVSKSGAPAASTKPNWALSLTGQGMTINTTISSMQDLYDLVAGAMQTPPDAVHVASSSTPSGTAQQNANDAAVTTNGTNSSDTSDPTGGDQSSDVKEESAWAEQVVITKAHPLYEAKGAFFPLYSSWEPTSTQSPHSRPLTSNKRPHDMAIDFPQNKKKKKNTSPPPFSLSPALPLPLIDQLLHHYAECCLCFPIPDMDAFLRDCRDAWQHPKDASLPRIMLTDALLAWSARHAAIYHDLFQGQDPNRVGEPFFVAARQRLTQCYLHPTLDTVHALLLMYIYSIGKTGAERTQASREAYVYLGLAIRMAMELGLHLQPPQPPVSAAAAMIHEKHCRLYSAIEFMETLCGTHSEKPMMLPAMDIVTARSLGPMDHEQGERRYRVEFTLYRHQISQIERTIRATLLPPNNAQSGTRRIRLAVITAFEKEIKNWYQSLPPYFQYDRDDTTRHWQSASFREQACLKLTFEYHSLLCQLYSLFLPRADHQAPHAPDGNDDEQPSSSQQPSQQPSSFITLLSLRVCVDAADAITELLVCWAQLQQTWCHFTLGTLVLACAVYSTYQLHHSSPKVVAATKKKMMTIHGILKMSPIQHHKHVRALMDRIEQDIRSCGPIPSCSPPMSSTAMLPPLPLAPATTSHAPMPLTGVPSQGQGLMHTPATPLVDHASSSGLWPAPPLPSGYAQGPGDTSGRPWVNVINTTQSMASMPPGATPTTSPTTPLIPASPNDLIAMNLPPAMESNFPLWTWFMPTTTDTPTHPVDGAAQHQQQVILTSSPIGLPMDISEQPHASSLMPPPPPFTHSQDDLFRFADFVYTPNMDASMLTVHPDHQPPCSNL